MATDKQLVPSYVSYRSMETFFTQRREDGHVTDVVDKSLMTNFSGATANELLSGLKYLKLVDDKGVPSPAYKTYVLATDDERKVLMGEILRSAYPWLFDTTKFNIERATQQQFVDLFKLQGPTGSTLYRGVAFFLGMAKFAGIKVSSNLKVPTQPRVPSQPKPKKDAGKLGNGNGHNDDDPADDGAGGAGSTGTQTFYIPIPIDRRVKIVIPADWAPTDWDRLTKMLQLYVEGWKELAPTHKVGPKKDKEVQPEE
ncbi:DUF5343 domain-containing protein [Hydrogenophaga sp. ZJX-1]|uniref:DUF5343 domain-containing protein n=1 Tax=Hydrogenophaga sp. ZJX-1 TaxID=3404778 RepID=UPI003B2876CE